LEAALQFSVRKIGDSVACRDLGIDMSHRWPRLDQRAADIKGDGLDSFEPHL
jgi:hypothetical protein